MFGSGIGDKILNALGVILAGVILAWLSRIAPKIEKLLHNSRKHKMPFEKEIERDTKCTALLNRALGELQADRIFYSKIHNGDSLETRKKSRVYEVVGPGMVNDFELYQNVPIGLVIEEMVLVEQEGASWNVLAEIPDSKFKRLLQISGVQGLARCAVRRNGKVIGLIGADFVRSSNKPVNIDKLCEYAAILEQILMLYETQADD